MKRTKRSGNNREHRVRSARVIGALAAALILPMLAVADSAPDGSSARTESGMGREVILGEANLHAINRSGIKARIDFVDDGATLMAIGTATGLDPAESYVTLIYDNGSVPGGPKACQPTIFDPEDPGFLLMTMFVGFWQVDPEGRGILVAINTNNGLDYVPRARGCPQFYCLLRMDSNREKVSS